MRINLVNNIQTNFYKKSNIQNPVILQNQITFNGLGDFITLKRNKIQAKKEANEIKARGIKILANSKEISKQGNEIQQNSKEITQKASKLEKKLM